MVAVPARQGEREWAARTALLIAGATVVRLLFVSTTDIANGEAYYYVWSRFPALSYYDHPPLVAWMAWLTTRASHGSLAVRAGPLVCAVLFGAGVFVLGRRLFSPRAGFLAVATVTIIPVFFASSYALNPEAPLAPLWVLGLILLEGMREHDEAWRPLAAGAVAGLAFLAKYSGVLLLGVGLLYVLVSPQGRRWLRRPSLYLGSLVALAGATPVLVWNQERGWPSLMLHFVERRAPTDPATLAVNAWHALVGQLGPLHPLVFPGLLVVLAICLRRSPRDDRYRFLALASWPVLLFFWGMMARVRDANHTGRWWGTSRWPSPRGGSWTNASGASPPRSGVTSLLASPSPSPAPPCSTPTPRPPPSAASCPRGRTTRTATSSTRCPAGRRSGRRSRRRPRRSDRRRWWRAASTRCARTSSPPWTTSHQSTAPGRGGRSSTSSAGASRPGHSGAVSP